MKSLPKATEQQLTADSSVIYAISAEQRTSNTSFMLRVSSMYVRDNPLTPGPEYSLTG